MLLKNWEPWADLNRLSREMDQLFGRRGNGMASPVEVRSFPALNVWENDDHLFIEAELPGFGLEDLEIYVTGNQLTLKGQRRPPQQEQGTWHLRERGYGKFHRVLELPTEIDGQNVSAEFRLGVLRITLAKSEATKPRRIQVKTD